METWLTERFAPLLMRLVFIVEPLAPRFASFFLERKLKEWKDKRLIDGYSVKTARIGKFHYKIGMDLVLTSEQARSTLRNYVFKIFKRDQEVNSWRKKRKVTQRSQSK